MIFSKICGGVAMFYDSTFILLIPAILFAFYAQMKVSSTFNTYLNYANYSGYTGAQAARALLDGAGLYNVQIELIEGHLTDHYDPRSRVLRLSPNVYHGRSVAAVGVAAHEVGHAIQHSTGYAPLQIRNGLFPIANIGSTLAWPLVILGFMIQWVRLIDLGIILFTAAVLFQIITLPVEFNASSRALGLLQRNGIIVGKETIAVKKVLDAAALTYVAATLVAIVELIRLLLIRSREE